MGLFKLKCWSVLQNLVPYMWQLVLAQVSVQRRVIGPDKHGFLLCLPMDYAETVWADWMSCGAGVLVDGALRCSLSLSPNALLVPPIYSSGQLICGHLYLYMTPLF